MIRKCIIGLVSAAMLAACSATDGSADYCGLSLSMSCEALVDSLRGRGFAVDSQLCSDDVVVLAQSWRPAFKLSIKHNGSAVDLLQESYSASKNDSTRQLWQQVRDSLEQAYGTWPNAPVLKDDHKEAQFEHNGCRVLVLLRNTYKPTMTVVYEARVNKGRK